MKCQLVKMSKTRGAAGLLVAALGILVSLAVPPSIRGSMETDAGFGAAPVVRTVAAPQTYSAADLSRGETQTARQFHAVAEPVTPSGWSSGSIGMFMLAAFSLLLVVAAFFLRSAQAHNPRH